MNAPAQTESGLIVIPAGFLPMVLAADENDILGKLRAEIDGFVPDISSEKGRTAIRSVKRKIGTARQDLIRLADGLKEDAAKQVKAVNAEVRILNDRMDDLIARISEPLTEWETAEKARIAECEYEIASIDHAARNLAPDASSDDISALIAMLRAGSNRDWREFKDKAERTRDGAIVSLLAALDRAVSREATARELARLQAEEAERQRLAAVLEQERRDERIAAEAADAARRTAERIAAQDAAMAERKAEATEQRIRDEASAAASKAQREAEEQAAQIERQRVASEQSEQRARESEGRAAVAAAEADRRIEAAKIVAQAEADRRAEEAVKAEQRRHREAAETERAEAERRAADKAHRGKVNRAILDAIILLGVTEDIGKVVIAAVARGEVPHVKINY